MSNATDRKETTRMPFFQCNRLNFNENFICMQIEIINNRNHVNDD